MTETYASGSDTTTAAPVAELGTVVSYYYDGVQRLGLVRTVTPPTPPSQLTWLRVNTLAYDHTTVISHTINTDVLDPVQAVLSEQEWADVQVLVRRAAAELTDDKATIERGLEDWQREAEARSVKIEELRAYAIRRYEAHDICRTGLDEFLDDNGLEPYEPRFNVNVTFDFTVEVIGDSDPDSAIRTAIHELRVVSDDEDLVVLPYEAPCAEAGDVTRADLDD